jgi:hypothetical protein
MNTYEAAIIRAILGGPDYVAPMHVTPLVGELPEIDDDDMFDEFEPEDEGYEIAKW